MWLRLLVVFLVFLVNAFAASYKGIRVGQNIADLPEQIRCEAVYCEGKYKGDWIRVSELGGKVLMFDVVYVGTSLDKEITISRALPLAKAIRLHSLQPGLSPPVMGLAARVDDHRIYGIVDTANAISYNVTGPPTNADSMVSEVSYLSPDAPLLRADLLPASQSSKLIATAQRASPDDTETAMSSTNDLLTFSSAREAREKLEEQSDVVIGKGRKTLALIREVSTWYEVDENHPEAKEKGEQLRQFLSQFKSEWGTLLRIYDNNKQRWRNSDLEKMDEPLALNKEIDSKKRQLEAMGFDFH